MCKDTPVVFDVGVVALAHSGTPMSGTALEYIREAIRGDLGAGALLDAVRPTPHPNLEL